MVVIIFAVWCLGGMIPVCDAQEEGQEQRAQNANAQNTIKLYEGEITNEMILSFLKADAKIRFLRQQITQATEKILIDENIPPEVYMAIAQKVRQDEEFLEKVRGIAASMTAEEATPAENATDTE